MKKYLLFLTAALLGCISALAQSSLIGTLSHDGEITVFYGGDALIKAHNAAVPGDVITLSAGTFTSTTITKALTIRGAGMMLEQSPTIISGRFDINVQEEGNEGHSLNLEGLRLLEPFFKGGMMKSPVFLKCYFDGSYGIMTYYDNATFINCFLNYFSSSSGYPTCSSTLINCVIQSYINNNSSHNVSLKNCIILSFKKYTYLYGYTTVDCNNTSWENCIIRGFDKNEHDNFAFSNSGNVFINCRYQGTGSDPFSKVTSSCTNTKKVSNDLVLFTPDTFYELSNELVNNEDWLGEDGSQIGIYGGTMPFDPTPTNPQITKFKVANKTSADGKLSVDIEVSAAK